jgi:hypothetical protein
MSKSEITRESFFRMKKTFSPEETAKALAKKGKTEASTLKGLGGLGKLPPKQPQPAVSTDLAETINNTLNVILDNQRIMDKLNEILEAVKSSNEKEILKRIDDRIKSEKLNIVINSGDHVDTIHANSMKDAVFKIASRLTTEEAEEHNRIVNNDTSDDEF